ncbi:MAG: twin-arginine translocase TatA/TatE family subunit [Gemmatimonadales bacterium]|jgi:sec-independent protein translocase protein TatA|nr:MAG: twin-arginine translocase TatA/TatE family subunit [Gemmatimonadales bacterium]
MGMGLGMWEILLIFLVVLLLFGAKRLPEIGSSLGKGIREFKGSLREIENELKTPEPPRKSIHSPPVSGPGARSDQRLTVEERDEDSSDDGEPRTLKAQQD